MADDTYKSSLDKATRELGKYFGIMFQIVDDWADFIRSKQDDHKDRGVDIANGFVTLPWLILLEQASEDEHARLIELIQKRQPCGLGDPFVRALSEKYGLADLLQQRLMKHKGFCDAALAGIDHFDASEMHVFSDFVLAEFAKIARCERGVG